MRLKVKVRPRDPSLDTLFYGIYGDAAARILNKFRFALVAVEGEKESTVALFYGHHDAMLAARMFSQYRFDKAAQNPQAGQFWKRRKGGNPVEIEAIYFHENARWVRYRFIQSGKVDQVTWDQFLDSFRLWRMAPVERPQSGK